MRKAVRLYLLLILTALTVPASPARAQDGDRPLPDFTPAPDVGSLTKPDWGRTADPEDQEGYKKPKDDFFERCMLTADDRLKITDQRAMCACMDAYKTRVAKEPKNTYWTSALSTRLVTPYETFVTRVFAPCMYLEAFTLGARECYRKSSYADNFPGARAFDQYCTCYATAAEDYTRKYAVPLLAAKMANPSNEEKKHPSDPGDLVMKDIDYRLYMDGERKRCTGLYGYQTSR